jgi:hypothetical protein
VSKQLPLPYTEKEVMSGGRWLQTSGAQSKPVKSWTARENWVRTHRASTLQKRSLTLPTDAPQGKTIPTFTRTCKSKVNAQSNSVQNGGDR